MGKLLWWAWMVVGVVLSAAYPLLPSDHVPSTVLYNSVGVLTALAIIAGVRINRPDNAQAWYVFAAGVFTFVAGDVYYEISGLVLGTHPYPYWDDLLYFAAYPLLWVGLLRIVRGAPGTDRRDLAGLIDAAVIATGLGLVYWVFVISPALADHSTPLFVRFVTIGYPTCDVVMCAVIIRILSRVRAITPSVLQLALGAGLTLACDIIWTLTSTFSQYAGGIINAGFLLGYVCWGGAALHPSVRSPAGRPGADEVNFGRSRFVLLAISTLLVPTVLFVQGSQHKAINWIAIGAGAVILFLLVLLRMSGFVDQVQEQAAQLEDLAMSDELTGLANRRRFEQRLSDAVAVGRAQVCLLDLNDFKVINDRHGHTVGDRLLVAVAERIAAALRDVDVVARMGGDEFAILVLGLTTDEGDTIAGRLAAVLREPFEVSGQELLIGASIGIADGAGTTDPIEVLRRADVAMYAAKADGGRFRRYGIKLDDQASEEARLGAEIRAGLAAEQFRLVYQPIVELPGGATRYVEALVRWQHPDRGSVSPADFIPVAEQNGLIIELGEWVLRTACAKFVTWQAAYGDQAPSRISVNVSARQLAEPDFAQVVADVLADTGMAADQLIVEVTETAVFGGGAAVRAVEDMHALGVRIALDDFGTGHSSLGLLQTVPVDVLKVDKSFVDNLTMAGRHAVIATALILLSNGLGLSAVAEGVETAEQAAELHRLGYQLAQGYHFGRPVPEPDFTGAAVVV